MCLLLVVDSKSFKYFFSFSWPQFKIHWILKLNIDVIKSLDLMLIYVAVLNCCMEGISSKESYWNRDNYVWISHAIVTDWLIGFIDLMSIVTVWRNAKMVPLKKCSYLSEQLEATCKSRQLLVIRAELVEIVFMLIQGFGWNFVDCLKIWR